MAVSINEICENTKLAREMALMGNYETSGVYYQGVVQQMHRLLQSIADPTRKGKWQLVSSTMFSIYVQTQSSGNSISIHMLSVTFFFSLKIQQQIAQEYEQVKALTNTLQLFRSDSHTERPLGKFEINFAEISNNI